MRDSSAGRSSAGLCSRSAAGDGKRGRESFPDQPISGMMPVELLLPEFLRRAVAGFLLPWATPAQFRI